jgi:parallel beta-helix repeat protein
MKRFASVVIACGASMLVLGATSAFGATHTVGCGTDFSTIQAAVNGSSAGDTINVCPGTYTEQVAIPAGKNGLTIQSIGHLAATIQAPASLSASKAIVEVTGSTNVKISDFTIQGPGSGGCDSLEYGVKIDGGGSATISNNHITHIRDNPFGGCQNGVAIQAGRSAESTTGSVVAKSNTIDDFQKNGITVSGAGSNGMISNNTIVGAGPTATIAQNGIQISSGATGTVSQNDVSGEVYSPGTTSSTAVLLFSPGAVTVSNNTLHAADTGVYVYQGTASTQVSGNAISGSTYDGISVDTSQSALVASNTISGGDQGIGVYNSQLNTIRVNTITGAHTNGLFADANTVSNTFQNNSATGTSAGFDCRDNTGASASTVLNTWKRNAGATSNPTGLCTP